MGLCMWDTSRMEKLKDWVCLSLLTDHTIKDKWWIIWQNHQRRSIKTAVFSILEDFNATCFMEQVERREFHTNFKESLRMAAESTES